MSMKTMVEMGKAPRKTSSAPVAVLTRIADARLEGEGVGTLAGHWTVEASSILSQVDWTGPAHGKITIDGPNGTVHAVFSGQLNLSLAILAAEPTPLAPISGTWRGTKGMKGNGRFGGAFVIPFQVPGTPPEWWFYLDLDENGQPKRDPETGRPILAMLKQNEFLQTPAGPVPLVKLRATFFSN
jgi:hypothetical protein